MSGRCLLWVSERALRGSRSEWLFPRYAADQNIRATHAANTANKWLKRLLNDTKTTHSFRHATRDRLRRVNAPEELADRIGGWGTRTVGMGYGEEDRLREIKAGTWPNAAQAGAMSGGRRFAIPRPFSRWSC